jgi:hypothetical protein
MLEHVLPLIARHPRHRLGSLARPRDPGIDRLASASAQRNATSPVNLSVTSRWVFGCFASLAR